MVEAFPALVLRTDDPIADIACYGYDAVMRAARAQGVTVMLSGQGGDELFWGYAWITEALRQTVRKARWQPNGRPEWQRYFNWSLPSFGSRRDLFDWCLSVGGLTCAYDQFQRDRRTPNDRVVFFEQSPWYRTIRDTLPTILTDRFRHSIYETELWKPFTRPHPWSGLDVLFTKLICETYLLENGMAQGDRLSMASSVELRLPLIDYRLVETVVGLRKVQPDHALPPKTWLKRAVQDLVPDWLLNQPKRGFQPPGGDWSRGVLSRYGHALEEGRLVQLSILRPEIARSMARKPWGNPLAFTALVLELWCAAYLTQLSETGLMYAAARTESVLL